MRRTSKKAWGRSSGFCHWTERICARQWAYLAWTEMTGKRRPKPVRCAVIRLCAGAEYTLHLAGEISHSIVPLRLRVRSRRLHTAFTSLRLYLTTTARSGRRSNRRFAMTWGIPTHLFLQIHVALSLIALVAGLVVLFGLLKGRALGGWTE